jgi:cyclase
MPISRRHFLRDGAQVFSAASLIGTGPVMAARSNNTLSVKDVNGLAMVMGSGCNVLALSGPEGALLVDGGLAEHSSALLKILRHSLNAKRINTLINTHWHPEQTGSNEAVGKSGGTLIAHEVSRLFLGRKSSSTLFAGTYGPLPIAARPTNSTYNTGSLAFAGEQVSYRYLPAAHTNGDLFVHFPKHNAIAAGGPVSADHWPVLDYLNGAFLHGFVRSYEILAEVVKPDTLIVPADGPTLTGADLLRHQKIYQELFKKVFVYFNKGLGPQDVIAERPLKDHEAELGDPASFLESAYRSVQRATIPH